MRISHFIRKIKIAIKYAKVGFCDGGITTVNLFYPMYGEILKGKNVLITGGGSGIGLAIAKKCAACGAHILITGRNIKKLELAVKEIGKEHCSSIIWDISSVENIEHKLDECRTILGGDISVLVNNAGIPPTKFWGNVDEDEWNNIYSINLKGMFFLSQAIVKRWKQNPQSNYRKILNISSQGGFVGAIYPYRMAKWDIRGLTEGLGKTLIKDNIIVNGIAPGVVKTSMQNFSLQQGDNLYTNQNPIERVILPEEIAELAIYLISDVSNAIVGQTIVCDGGYTLK